MIKLPFEKASILPYPVGSITQYFGENAKLYMERCGLKAHNGVDFVAPHGTPMFAIEDGIIADVKDNPNGYGKNVVLLAGEHEWVYGHCDEIYSKVGDEVKAGDIICTMGNTGFVVSGSTPFWKFNPYAGTHLHLGLRICKRVTSEFEPHNITYANGMMGMIQNYDNGYRGAIDYLDLFPKVETPPVVVSKAKYGETSKNVAEIQKRLGVIQTGFYGLQTSKAVLEWQLKNNIDTPKNLNKLGGKVFGPKSVFLINSLSTGQ